MFFSPIFILLFLAIFYFYCFFFYFFTFLIKFTLWKSWETEALFVSRRWGTWGGSVPGKVSQSPAQIHHLVPASTCCLSQSCLSHLGMLQGHLEAWFLLDSSLHPRQAKQQMDPWCETCNLVTLAAGVILVQNPEPGRESLSSW